MQQAGREESLFQALLSTAVDGIIVIDSQGIVNLYNRSAEKLFGYAPEEVLGRNVSMLMPSPYREEHDGYLENYVRTGRKKIIGIGREVVGRRKDGTTFPMYLSVGESVLNGARIFVGIVHDLTSRTITAQRLQDLQVELLHASRLSAMGQMTAALAHELNQPLSAILNYINAARRTLSNTQDPQAGRASDLIEKAVTQTARAGQIIRQLREFVEKRETSRAPANINLVIEEALLLASINSADPNVKIIIAFEPNLPPVMIDRVQVQQVIVNLARNSVEAMQTVAERKLKLATAFIPDGVKITVSDSGPGLAPEVADRLFHPFVSTKEKGMGIGLSICQSIIQAHGGRISAGTGEMGGAEFRIVLPVASED
jgi:two-component system, LuxR family, sensor kinase FixL